MSAPQALYASVSYRKVPGTLQLGPDGVLKWSPSSSSSSVPAFEIQDQYLNGMQVSKPGAAQVALRLVAKEGHKIHGETSAMLNFNAERETAMAHRELFKERLAAAIAKARSAEGAGPGALRKESTSSSQVQGEAPVVSEVKLRGQVLLANPTLLALHKDVVGTGILSDSDFWAHPARAALLRAERARVQQRTGRSARIAGPHPTQGESGELKINITPQLIRQLFEQYPVLTRAYNENVPQKLDESTFWMRYFQSKLYHRLRTSQRSAASEQHLPDDDIFDRYLEPEDDHLASTEQDHEATGNAQDWTMRPGYDRRALPLVRRFNRHAESLLNSSLGELTEADAQRVRRKTGGVGEEYGTPLDPMRYEAAIVLDDLKEHAATPRRRLDIQDPNAYYGASAAGDNSPNRGVQVDAKQFQSHLQAWQLDLTRAAPRGSTMRHALDDMLKNMTQQKEGRQATAVHVLPPPVYKQMISCHAATCEFLQQFWQAVLPAVEHDTGAPHAASPLAQRVTKARQMIQVLQNTTSRVQSIAEAAEEAVPGTGYDTVMEAFNSTQEAVARALAYAAPAT